jgi:hypothetical protein
VLFIFQVEKTSEFKPASVPIVVHISSKVAFFQLNPLDVNFQLVQAYFILLAATFPFRRVLF